MQLELDPFSVRVCNIARLNRELWPQPRIRLMTEAGVFDPVNRLDVKAIAAVIRQNPTLFDDWLMWSEDKRYSGPSLDRRYGDMALGCAKFIVAELGMFKAIRQRGDR